MSLVGQVFALGYLDKEWSLARFYALVGFFEGAMAGVVLSSNLFMSYFLLEMLTLPPICWWASGTPSPWWSPPLATPFSPSAWGMCCC